MQRSILLLLPLLLAAGWLAACTERTTGLEAGVEPSPTPLPRYDEPNLDPTTVAGYTWVILTEVTPPGEQYPMAVTKREGAFLAPDRLREIAGGSRPGPWTSEVVQVGMQARSRENVGSGLEPWRVRDGETLGRVVPGYLPYWDLFAPTPNGLAVTTPALETDEYNGTSVLRYELPLATLPHLRQYLAEAIAAGVPGASADPASLANLPVAYWLRVTDGRPVRIQIYPAAVLQPETGVSFNIRIQHETPGAIDIPDP